MKVIFNGRHGNRLTRFARYRHHKTTAVDRYTTIESISEATGLGKHKPQTGTNRLRKGICGNSSMPSAVASYTVPSCRSRGRVLATNPQRAPPHRRGGDWYSTFPRNRLASSEKKCSLEYPCKPLSPPREIREMVVKSWRTVNGRVTIRPKRVNGEAT